MDGPKQVQCQLDPPESVGLDEEILERLGSGSSQDHARDTFRTTEIENPSGQGVLNLVDSFALRSAGLFTFGMVLEPRQKTDFNCGLRFGVPGEISGWIGVWKKTPMGEAAIL